MLDNAICYSCRHVYNAYVIGSGGSPLAYQYRIDTIYMSSTIQKQTGSLMLYCGKAANLGSPGKTLYRQLTHSRFTRDVADSGILLWSFSRNSEQRHDTQMIRSMAEVLLQYPAG